MIPVRICNRAYDHIYYLLLNDLSMLDIWKHQRRILLAGVTSAKKMISLRWKPSHSLTVRHWIVNLLKHNGFGAFHCMCEWCCVHVQPFVIWLCDVPCIILSSPYSFLYYDMGPFFKESLFMCLFCTIFSASYLLFINCLCSPSQFHKVCV